VSVSGFNDGGISILSEKGRSGYKSLKIENSEIFDNSSHGIGLNGFYSTDFGGYSFEKVHIIGNKVYGNTDEKTVKDTHTGSGIILGNTDGAIVIQLDL